MFHIPSIILHDHGDLSFLLKKTEISDDQERYLKLISSEDVGSFQAGAIFY